MTMQSLMQKVEEIMKRMIIVGIAILILVLFGLLLLKIRANAATLASDGSQSAFQITETLVVIEPEGTDSTWFAQYIIRIKYDGVVVARKRLCITAEWLDAEHLVRVISASSPEREFDSVFHWERRYQNLRSTTWSAYVSKWASSKLWNDNPGGADVTYRLVCEMYGSMPGTFICHLESW